MKTVLIIEDETILRKDIVDLLQFENYRALEAETGTEGVEQARLHMPDLIICDISIPEMDGYEVLRTLRSDHEFPQIPFIFLTARAERQDIEKGLSMGANDYLTKPFTIQYLLSTVRKWTGN
jgi:two-component system, sensor histidine kinase and response regulator